MSNIKIKGLYKKWEKYMLLSLWQQLLMAYFKCQHMGRLVALIGDKLWMLLGMLKAILFRIKKTIRVAKKQRGKRKGNRKSLSN